MQNKMISTPTESKEKKSHTWITLFILLYIILMAAFFRFSGIFWGEYQYLHPDERFLVWVGSDISPVENLSAYFNTAESSLNPHNRNHGFYVYGTLPMFITRYLVEWIFGQSGFMEMTQVGRVLSSLADLFTIVLVFLIAREIFDRRVALLASAFSAGAVLQIQQSHFFTMDTFLVMFSTLALYCAVIIITNRDKAEPFSGTQHETPDQNMDSFNQIIQIFVRLLKNIYQDKLFLPSLGFGIALGLAMASKLDAVLIAFALPLAMAIYYIQVPPDIKIRRMVTILGNLFVAAIASLLIFRIFQPYAFEGPSFFGVRLNPLWFDNIRSLLAQSGGDVDFPPAMQWARRSYLFSLKNMLTWGLGLPLGLLACFGFLWSGWRIITTWKNDKHPWQYHALIWSWTALYFLYQSIRQNATMRYQLPIYPMLSIFAAWAIIAIYDYQQNKSAESKPKRPIWTRLFAIAIGSIVLISTLLYAFGFSQIYTRPITRIEASRWIYENISGAITLPIQTDGGIYHQSIPVPYELSITPELPFSRTFQPNQAGTLQNVQINNLHDLSGKTNDIHLELKISSQNSSEIDSSQASLSIDHEDIASSSTKSFEFSLEPTLLLDPEQTYTLNLSVVGDQTTASILDQPMILYIKTGSGETPTRTIELSQASQIIKVNQPYLSEFSAEMDGILSHLSVGAILDQTGKNADSDLRIRLQAPSITEQEEFSDLNMQEIPGGQGVLLILENPIAISKGEIYQVSIERKPAGPVLAIQGTAIANEGEWDDGLPLRIDGYDGYSGIYPRDLNLNMYWDDNLEKVDRFVDILTKSEYLTISSSRQWGSLPRIPERFPMTTIYYRELLGCPPDRSIEYCYNVAEPGRYQGNLGFELEETFTSNPKIGQLEINDQFAEEALTVYDHPKVFIFRKIADFDQERVREILSQADFSKIIRKPPMQYEEHPETLLLPEYRLAQQQSNGTWSQLFNTDSLVNRWQPLTVLIWYLAVSLLGLIAYPILRLATPGLHDRAYPMTRIAGMLILSYLVWIAGSFRIPFSRSTISLILLFLGIISIWLYYHQRTEILEDLRDRKNYYLLIEAVTLLLFLTFLLIRFGNPDLWHPWKGGEKPMDFAYFNAVLKSSSFPPYDPWFAGGYLNYYYFGFVFVGVLVKFLGIVPAVAYNLIIPTLFSMIAMGAFSIAWNLSIVDFHNVFPKRKAEVLPRNALISAFSAMFGVAILGNLGIVRMIYQGYQKLVAPGGIIEDANLITHWVWALRGFVKHLGGVRLPYSIGDWYWLPSRAIPAPGDIEPITEFPFFSVLYADLHAHLLALPLTLLALGLAVAFLLGKAQWKNFTSAILWFILAGITIGALRPTNTWDLPTYLVIALAVVGYTLWTYYEPTNKSLNQYPLLQELPKNVLRYLVTLAGLALLTALVIIMFKPFTDWYALGYNKIKLWEGTRTPISAYLTHWGLFLFVIISWMTSETISWMASTPVSALRKIIPYQKIIIVSSIILVVIVVFFSLPDQFQIEGSNWKFRVPIAWFVIPLITWVGILLLRKNNSDVKRLIIFLIGSGLFFTIMVEVTVFVGDIGRMNWVFKFYLQVWTLFAISAAVVLGWIFQQQEKWVSWFRNTWGIGLAMLIFGAALYPLMASLAKVDDRMDTNAPPTLDGMEYMRTSQYTDEWGIMDLVQDYDAIRWMQENVEGSPVIVEANLRNLYRWGSRFSIYTGLPSVVGWEWHQQQQRAVNPGAWVSERISEIDNFYLTPDWNAAEAFLKKYQVRYIIVGQQERGHYQGPGLNKFEEANGILWREVYRSEDTVIYEVPQEQIQI